jgi:hypothetical protein
VRGVGDPVGEFTVVGQQQQALGVDVEAAHVEHPFRAVRDVVPHTRQALLIGHGRRHTSRFVQRQDHMSGSSGDPRAINMDDRCLWIDAGAENRNLAVDGDPPISDQLIAHAATADACRCEHLLKSLAVHSDLAGEFRESRSARSGR